MNQLLSSFTLDFSRAEPPVFQALAALLAVTLIAQAAAALLFPRRSHWMANSLLLGGALGLLGVLLGGSGSIASLRISLSGQATPHALSLGVEFDRLGAGMLALVGFLGWVIVRFSATYLRSEPRRDSFLAGLTKTALLVQLFALSTSLLGHALLWLPISVSVHRLLRHYEERTRARTAAKKKFLMSRAADCVVYIGMGLLFVEYGTLDIQELSQQGRGSLRSDLSVAALALGVLMKSAQFPFHSWLPETMDAPTPVSAIMHAGVINAGAFLLLRISPLLATSALALGLLIFVGGLTAAFGTLVGSVQPSVKLRLGYSTIGQMGFLFFELGLGHPEAAALHLIAHASYKAHAFLRSGTSQPRPSAVASSPARILAAMGGSVALVGFGVGLGALAFGPGVWDYAPLALVWGLASSQYLLDPAPVVRQRIGLFLALGAGVWGLAFSAEAALSGWFSHLPSALERGPLTWAVTTAALGTLAVTLYVCSLGRFSTPRLRRLYVHALSGFYLGELTDRLTLRLWPDSPSESSPSHPTFDPSHPALEKAWS